MGLEDPPRFLEPLLGKAVVVAEAAEAVPAFLNAVDAAVVGTVPPPFEGGVEGGAREEGPPAPPRQATHLLEQTPQKYPVQCPARAPRHCRFCHSLPHEPADFSALVGGKLAAAKG